MFKLTDKENRIRHDVASLKATIRFEIRYENSTLDLVIGAFGTVIIDGQEHSANVSTEYLYLNEGKLLDNGVRELDGLVLFENLYRGNEPATNIYINGEATDVLGSHEDTAIYSYVDQPLEMGSGVLMLNHLAGTTFRLVVNGDIDFYLVEVNIKAEYVGGSIVLTNELGDDAKGKLLVKFEKTFSASDYVVSFRDSNGHTYLEFSPDAQ